MKAKSLVTLLFLSFAFLLSNKAKAQTNVSTFIGGGISACVGSASVFPHVVIITITAQGLTTDITATVSAGFEASLSIDAGYSNSVIVSKQFGNIGPIKIYIRSAMSVPAGSISGTATLVTAGVANQVIPLTGIINPLPTVNLVANQTVNNGLTTAPINFTGTANTFYWTNNTPGIGLAGNGYGDIPAFKPINKGTTPITATITVNPINAGFAYITNRGDSTVSVINTLSHKVVQTLTVSPGPWPVAISPDGNRAYIGCYTTGDIWIINTKDNTIISKFSSGASPIDIEVTQDGSRLYIADAIGNVYAFDGSTYAFLNAINLGDGLNSIAISSDGSRLYASAYTNTPIPIRANKRYIAIVNTTTNTMIDSIGGDVNILEDRIALTPDGTKIYASSGVSTRPNGNGIGLRLASIYDLIAHKQIPPIPILGIPEGLVISPDGSKVYVANYPQGYVSAIDVATNTFSNGYYDGKPYEIGISPDGSELYLMNITFNGNTAAGTDVENTVSIMSTATLAVFATVKVGNSPSSRGNFVSPGTNCTGPPITFTITVNPDPVLTTTPATGSIAACIGTAPASPNIQQFTVAGAYLAGDIKATAPANFEISLSPGSGYADSLTIGAVNNTVANTPLYVRTASTAPTGSLTGNIAVSTKGATTQQINVSATVAPAAIADFTTPSVCLTDAYAQFTDKSTEGNNGQFTFTWLWDFGDSFSTPANNTSTQQNPKHKYSHTGVYTTTLTVISANGCTNTVSKSFTVNGAVPQAAFTVQNKNALCSSDSVRFNDQSTVDFGNVTKLVWFYDYNNNPADSTVFTGANLRTDKIYSHFYGLNTSNSTKTYQVQLFAYSGQTCFSPVMQNITVYPTPVVTLSPSGNISLCQSDPPLPISQTSNIPGRGVFSGTGVNSNGIFDPKLSGPGTFVISYLFTANTTGCTYVDTLHITVSPAPVITVPDNNISIIDGGQVTLNPTVAIAGGAVSYKWSPSTGLDNNSILNPVATPKVTTLYTLTVTSGTNCYATANVTVTVLPSGPVVPNTFTPNGDGVNDVWNIKYLNQFPNSTIQVNNRYGTQVYYSRSYPTPWDGKHNGANIPAGVYYYIINLGNGSKNISGSVTIIR